MFRRLFSFRFVLITCTCTSLLLIVLVLQNPNTSLYAPYEFYLNENTFSINNDESSILAEFIQPKVDIEVNGHSVSFNKEFVKQTSEKIRIHLIFHSHVDPGWLMTFEEYYVDKVFNILSSAVASLNKYPKLRFIWSETSFLERWWRDASDKQKKDIKKQIITGQLEISGGAWVMTDEATPLFYAAIENLIEGHQFIHNTFGIRPNTSWSVDPFGHGAMLPHLLPLTGIDHMVIGRFHEHIKKQLRKHQTMRWIWNDIYTTTQFESSPRVHSLPYFVYTTEEACPQKEVCRCYHVGPSSNAYCSRESNHMVNMTGIKTGNLTRTFLKQLRAVQTLYGTEDVLAAIGDDFFFQKTGDFDQMFDGFQKMADYCKEHPELNAEIRFSTVSEYFNSISKVELPSLRGDFFPYTSNRDAPSPWWTGYYTHRPHSKRMERILQNSLRSLDLIQILSGVVSNSSELQTAKRNLALFQHHDGITGTSKPHVMEDYEERMRSAFQIFKAMFPTTTSDSKGQMIVKSHEGETEVLPLKKNKKLYLSIFNSHTFAMNHTIRVNTDCLVSVILEDEHLTVQTSKDKSIYKNEFVVSLPPLSLTVLTLGEIKKKEKEDNNYITNLKFGLHGKLRAINIDNFWIPLNLTFYSLRDNGAAYVFEPSNQGKEMLVVDHEDESGSIAFRRTYRFNNSKLEVQVTSSSDYYFDVQIKTDVIEHHSLLMHIATNINSNSFWTDANGLYHIERKYQHAMDDKKLPFEANFYPAASSVFVQGEQWRMTIITGQSCAVTSRSSGDLDLLLDRRLHGDDGKGLGIENSYDNRTTTLKYRVLFEKRENVESSSPLSPAHSFKGFTAWNEILYPPLIMYSKAEVNPISFLNIDWPVSIQLVTWRPLNDKIALLVLRRNVFDATIPIGEETENSIEEFFAFLSSRSPSIFIHTSLTGTKDEQAVTVESFVRGLREPYAISAFKTQLVLDDAE